MLPGLRFLFAAIMLSMSMLVFGLGAAALLRAAHQEFAVNPSWHATPETMFAQRGDAARPVLAMMRVDDTPAAKQPPSDGVAATAPAEQAPMEATPAEKIAALKPEDSPPPETAKPQIPIEAASPSSDVAPAPVASAIETETAAVLSSASAPTPTPLVQATSPEQANATKSQDTGGASTRIATRGGSPVAVEPGSGTRPEGKTVKIKKRKHPRRTVHRHRLAPGARVAGQTLQPAANPFAQPTNQ
ncbi:MAG: hypothetical protein E7813_02345 [Bradyrhizobium sp.]|uniref:hypothetical protein n=1 Tax=Bradyrhizobium sp. TaxID=376 RepID=UPI0011FE2E84|nr:hypothetical protein [Bradyrhizobium sp.]THD73699.1 MAG: hypothetical protein E7813_02345 [Bradyrhizobium sp.]